MAGARDAEMATLPCSEGLHGLGGRRQMEIDDYRSTGRAVSKICAGKLTPEPTWGWNKMLQGGSEA